ncbi:hypothetical protein OG229_02470 [Streptomyces platensis]|uniref:hypothetical protein n=1 Tax=Streptomyces platensis TaxID=58346 RepID=UPI002E148D1F|nr:hypothetical protein OG229_02470 [Streptomyces platensis]
MATVPAPFPGDSDPSITEALRRITDPVERLADLDERRADRCVEATLGLLERGATDYQVAAIRDRARRAYEAAAAATVQPAWSW